MRRHLVNMSSFIAIIKCYSPSIERSIWCCLLIFFSNGELSESNSDCICNRSNLHSTPWYHTRSCYLWFATLLGGWHYTLLVTNNCNLFYFSFSHSWSSRDELTGALFFLWYLKVDCRSRYESFIVMHLPILVVIVWPYVCFVLVYLICFLHVLPFQLLVVCDELWCHGGSTV